MGESDYPISILPRTTYIKNIDFDALVSQQAVFLVRRSDKLFGQIFYELDGEYLLRQDAFEPNEIPNLSLNLLGGFFEEAHICYRVTGAGAQSWDGVSFIDMADFVENYTIIDPCIPIFIHANPLHNIKIPYQVPKKEFRTIVTNFYESVGLALPSFEKEKIDMEGSAKFCHDATNLNYWHVELRLFDFKKDIIKSKSSTWIKNFCEYFIANEITLKSYAILPEINSIPVSIYEN